MSLFKLKNIYIALRALKYITNYKQHGISSRIIYLYTFLWKDNFNVFGKATCNIFHVFVIGSA